MIKCFLYTVNENLDIKNLCHSFVLYTSKYFTDIVQGPLESNF